MRKLALITAILAAGLLFINPIEASAHGKEHHGGAADAQMERLHAMMPFFSIASAELESTLDKGDTVGANTVAEKIMAYVPDLKKSKTHKNAKQRKKFVELAANFEKAMTFTVDRINKGDLSGAKAAFKKVEKVCAVCHATFRD